jgi:hypothetical protein
MAAVLAMPSGCGTTKSRLATEQLLMSDAVDDAIGAIDFRSLSGERVYFDTRYLVNVKGVGFVNAEYIISSLRQQMIAADVRLQEKLENAEYVVEARVGTLGTDGNEIVYGVPANRGLSEAASMLPNAPPLPALPELSLARKESQIGAVKVAAYAYDRKSGEPIWQSGIARAKTTSQDVWLFGAGPFQQGSIHARTTFAGSDIRLPGRKPKEHQLLTGPPVPFGEEFHFRGWEDDGTSLLRTVQHIEAGTTAGADGGQMGTAGQASGLSTLPADGTRSVPAVLPVNGTRSVPALLPPLHAIPAAYGDYPFFVPFDGANKNASPSGN